MPRDTAGRVMKTAESFAGLAARGPAAPQTFLNLEIGRDRRVGFAKTGLEAVKAAKGSDGATVNDVILVAAPAGSAVPSSGVASPCPNTSSGWFP